MRKPYSPSELGFSNRDLIKLTKALAKAREIRLYRCIQAVLLIAEGHKVKEVSKITGLSLKTIYNLVNRYLSVYQIDILADLQRSGRPTVATCITKMRILRVLQKNPLKLGYKTNVWTVELLAKYFSKRYECSINPRTLRRRMKNIDLVCKRPRYFYSEKDPNRAQKKGALLGD